MDWDEIQKAIIGNLATTIFLGVLVLGVILLLSPFGYRIIRKKGGEEKKNDTKPKNNKIALSTAELLTSYPKPIENEVKGRDSDLTELELLLGNSKDVLLLSGMGGIGKTTLAAYYIQQNVTDYNSIAWINTSQGFYEAFAFNSTLIKAIKAEEKLKEIQTTIESKDYPKAAYDEIIYQLNQRSGKLLLVIDNAIEGQPLQTLRDDLIRDWKLLITSREPLGEFTQYPVGVLNEKEAIELFIAYYTRENKEEVIREILQRIAYHTLTIELIAKTAQQKNHYTLGSLKFDLESKGLTVAKGIEVKVKYSQVGGHEAYSTHIMECLQMAFDISLIEHSDKLNYVLTNYCLLPAIPIAFEMLCDFLGFKEEKDKNHFNTILNDLVAKGWLVKGEKNEDYRIHPVIQEALQTQLQPQPNEVDSLVISLVRLLRTDEKTHGIEKVPFMPYAENVLNYFFNEKDFLQEQYDISWENIATLANNLSTVYKEKGDLEQALQYQERAIVIREKVFKGHNLDLGQSYNNLSLIYRAKGDLDNALQYQEQATEIYGKSLDNNHPYLAISYNNLSLIYHAKGDLEQALQYQEQAVEIYKEVLEENHPHLAISYNNLSMIYKETSDLDNALKYQGQSIEIKEKVLKKDNPDLAISYNNLSLIYQAKGDLDNALKYQEKAIRIYEKVLEQNHPYLGVSYGNLASIYEAMEQEKKTAEYFQKSEAIRELNKHKGWS